MWVNWDPCSYPLLQLAACQNCVGEQINKISNIKIRLINFPFSKIRTHSTPPAPAKGACLIEFSLFSVETPRQYRDKSIWSVAGRDTFVEKIVMSLLMDSKYTLTMSYPQKEHILCVSRCLLIFIPSLLKKLMVVAIFRLSDRTSHKLLSWIFL